MTIVDWLKPTLAGSRSIVVYECRRCGATLTADGETCPFCGPTDVVRYDIT